MIQKFFIYLSGRLSFGAAVAIFSTSWSWIASFYGFFFVFATVAIKPDDLIIIIVTQLLATAFAVFSHMVHFGLLHNWGISGFTKSLRLINKSYRGVFDIIRDSRSDSSILLKLYKSILYLPMINLITAVAYAYFVVVVLIFLMYYLSGNPVNAALTATGGSFGAIIIGYFTYNITEYLSGPYKQLIEEELFNRNRNFRNRYFFSIKYKSIFTLLLVFVSMIILMVLIRSSEKSMVLIITFIVLSVSAIGFLIFLSLNTINISLKKINRATRELASGGQGFYFPSFSDRELVIFSNNYNSAAVEINEIRANLEKKITERTEELKKAYDSLNFVYKQIQADLLLAKRIQDKIMPKDPENPPGIEFLLKYFPMSDIGGDIYCIDRIRDDYLRIFIADAMGHGIQAALVTMIIKAEYEKFKKTENPASFIEKLNGSFIKLYNSLNVFFSCAVADFDFNNRTLEYVSAGHPDQLFNRGNSLEVLPHTGKLVGIKKDSSYSSIRKKLVRGDKIIFFTDGLYDQFNDNEEAFGETRIKDIVLRENGKGIDGIIEAIFGDLAVFMGDGRKISANDDITLIAVEIKE